jgi:hypothetical protein
MYSNLIFFERKTNSNEECLNFSTITCVKVSNYFIKLDPSAYKIDEN